MPLSSRFRNATHLLYLAIHLPESLDRHTVSTF